MKNKVLRVILAIILLMLILVLSYEENKQISEIENDYDASLGSIFPFKKDQAPEIEEIEEEQIPEYIKNSPCGSYFRKTGICGGTCPEGVCTASGRSCYCKLTS